MPPDGGWEFGGAVLMLAEHMGRLSEPDRAALMPMLINIQAEVDRLRNQSGRRLDQFNHAQTTLNFAIGLAEQLAETLRAHASDDPTLACWDDWMGCRYEEALMENES